MFSNYSNSTIRLTALLTLMLLPAAAGHTHPHMLLMTQLEVDFQGRQCTGIRVDWGFDRFFSQSVIGDYDLDGDGRFDSRETEDVYNYAFINLAHYGYFLYFRQGNSRVQPGAVTDFSVRQADGQVFYNFYVPVKDLGLTDNFSISVFDPTYFCAVRYADDPVTLLHAGGPEPSFELVENTGYPVYYNPLGDAGDNRTYDSWKPGLETAYPEEVHVFFK